MHVVVVDVVAAATFACTSEHQPRALLSLPLSRSHKHLFWHFLRPHLLRASRLQTLSQRANSAPYPFARLRESVFVCVF